MSGIRMPVFILIFLPCIAQIATAEESFDLWRGKYRISAETAELPGDERMGIAGVNYFVDIAPWLYGGIGAYGAMTGQRGGFLVGGIATGIMYPLVADLSLDGGVFIGGGGGKAALVGGGLMVRSHAGLLYDAKSFRVGLQYVNLDFPDGAIRSGHAALTFDIPFTSLRLRSGLSQGPSEILAEVIRTTGREPVYVRDFFGPLLEIYSPFSGTRNMDGATPTGRISLVGFEYGRYFTDRGYLFLETAGAMGGDADGYAELFFGGGYDLPLFPGGGRLAAGSLALDSRLSIGSGGGGRVDAGGGGLSKAMIGLRYSLTDRAQISVSGGLVDAFRGDFRATVGSLYVSYGLEFISFDGRVSETGLSRGDVTVLDWRFRLSNQVYLTEDERMRKIRSDQHVSLMGAKVDVDVTTNLYLTGQALGAYGGGAGGYAVGLMGPGLRSGRLLGSGARIFVEALFGASGGGGIDVGGGAIIQPSTGIVYDIGDWLSIEASCGKVKALHGRLDTTVYDVGMVYRFSTLARNGSHQ